MTLLVEPSSKTTDNTRKSFFPINLASKSRLYIPSQAYRILQWVDKISRAWWQSFYFTNLSFIWVLKEVDLVFHTNDIVTKYTSTNTDGQSRWSRDDIVNPPTPTKPHLASTYELKINWFWNQWSDCFIWINLTQCCQIGTKIVHFKSW